MRTLALPLAAGVGWLQARPAPAPAPAPPPAPDIYLLPLTGGLASMRAAYAWMADGKTILMPAGTKVFSWTRGASGWSEVFDGSTHQLGAITRLAVSPKGDAVAMVVAEPKRP